MDYIHLNGQLLPYDEGRVAPGDAGFLHGAGLFETMRARRGTIFRLGDHLARLRDSANVLGIELSLVAEELQAMADDLLEANDLRAGEARVRLTVTRGDTLEASAESGVPPVTLLLTAISLVPYPRELYENGMSVIISRYKQNPQNALTGHKTTSYLDKLLGLREAHLAKAGEALWFTPGNETLAEGSISNVFIVDKEGVLATPPLTLAKRRSDGQGDSGSASVRLCLAGITRKCVLEAAVQSGVLPHERVVTMEDIAGAREIFLTNAIMGVMPVTRVDGETVGDGKPGEIGRKMREAYEDRVAVECG